MGKKRRTSAAHKAQRAPIAATPIRRGLSGTQFEYAGIAGLVALAIYFVSVSWRKWPDPLIDFGRELYLPWRIANGAVLYRDLEGHYGPLAQHFNALIFKVFGASLMVLVTTNLIIFAAIMTAFYLSARRAWGIVGALSGSAIFISVFGFSQLVGISNYTYAAPYAHETTHGMFVVLLLVAVLIRWVEIPLPRWSFAAGFLFGLTSLLKAEFVLAAGLLGLTAAIVRWRSAALPSLSSVGAAVLGAILPVAAFTIYFCAFFPLPRAVKHANQAWLGFSTPAAVSQKLGTVQTGFVGLQQANNNLREHAVAALLALLTIGAIAAIAWASKRITRLPIFIAIAGACVVAAGVISARGIGWINIGHCLLGVSLVYLLAQFVLIFRGKITRAELPRSVARLLFAMLAVALMTRMALNGRIFQYGFFQAVIAGSIIPAVVMSEIAERIHATMRERLLIIAIGAALFIPGVCKIAGISHQMFAMKTSSIGEGADRFYVFDRKVEPTGEIVGALVNALKKDASARSLLVLPEGTMINYLARLRNPQPFFFYAIPGPGFAQFVAANPPDRVIFISRDLREYGIERYGAEPGPVAELRAWLAQNYRQIGHVGGDPFDIRQRGAILLKRNDAE